MITLNTLQKSNKGNLRLVQVKGYGIKEGLSIYRDETDMWVIMDNGSGAKVSEGFGTFQEAKDRALDPSFLNGVFEARKGSRYRKMCETLQSLIQEQCMF